MDASAVQALVDLAVSQTQNAAMNRDDIVIVPNTAGIKSLEQYNRTPNSFKARFETNVLSEFINYINCNADNESSCIFINKENSSANGIIDLGYHLAPEWGRHRAYVTLKKTPAYAAVISENNKVLGQQDFIDFCEDWQPNIKFFYGTPADTGTQSFPSTIATLRKLKVTANAEKEHVVGNFAASASALEAIEIKAGNVELPTGFLFETNPHDEFYSIVLVCQLRAAGDEKSVKLKYRINQLEASTEVIANEFRDKITKGVAIDLPVYIGDMAYQ